jgi:hypothetical protein
MVCSSDGIIEDARRKTRRARFIADKYGEERRSSTQKWRTAQDRAGAAFLEDYPQADRCQTSRMTCHLTALAGCPSSVFPN